MFLKRLVYLLLGASILILPACAAFDTIPTTGGDSAAGSLANTRWRLVSYGQPGSESAVSEGSDITLEFHVGDQAGGSAGCNTFGAQYEISNANQLSISDITSTLMACTDEVLMAQETQYLDALRSAESFEQNGESLTIRHAGGVLNFIRIAAHIPNIVNI